ncbi:MAG: arylsulfatase [Capnocytophaga sp.]|nr:arylsulfatase [Capnocytophaga sp.]
MKFLLLLAAVSLIGCKTQRAETPFVASTPPNVIIILADDIGYGDLSCYGESTISTPHVDKLSEGGIRFTNAHTTAATCTPSRYSLLTGDYNWRRTDTGIADGDAPMVIKPGQSTLAQVFRSAGYHTGVVGKWHLGLGDTKGGQDWNGYISPGPKDIGFDYSYIMAATGDRVPCVWIENHAVANYDPEAPISVSYTTPFGGEPLGREHPELLTKLRPSPNHGHDQAIVNGISRIGYMKGGGKALWQDENIADTIASKAVQFIEKNKKTPFFLYVGTNDIHVPRYPHSRFAGKSGMGHRGDAILQFDWTVGEIVQALERNHLMDNTLVIITSDNGPVINDGYDDQSVELLGEHRPWADFHPNGGKYSNFTAGTRVPFIVHWQKSVSARESDALVSQVDLYASMAALVNCEKPQNEAIDSQNVLEALLGKSEKGRAYVIASAGSLSIHDGTWKYIVPNQRNSYNPLTNTQLGNSPADQLYNIANDKAEQYNVAEQYPEEVSRLKNWLNAEINNCKYKLKMDAL